jgi:hypothetical protein
MNRKPFIILLLAGLAAGFVAMKVVKSNRESFKTSDTAEGQKVIPNFPINDIAQLRIKAGDGEVNLVKKDDLWRVKERYDYPANFSELSDLLRKIQDLKTTEEVKVGASQMGRLELNAPDKGGSNTATLVEFKDAKGANLKSLLLGKKYSKNTGEEPSPMGGGSFPVGRYVLVPDGANKVWLINDPLSNVETKPENWISKDFFKVEKMKSISVTHADATNSWTLTREKEGGEMKLADVKPGEAPDTGKVSGAGYALSSPTFSDVLALDAKAEETGLDKPLTAKLETFDGFVYDVKLGKAMKEENYPLRVAVQANFPKEREAVADEKPEDKAKLDKEFKDKLTKLEEKLKQEQAFEKWTFLVAKWSVDPLLKERKDLMADKKDEKKEGAEQGHEGHDHGAENPLPGLGIPQIPLPQ